MNMEVKCGVNGEVLTVQTNHLDEKLRRIGYGERILAENRGNKIIQRISSMNFPEIDLTTRTYRTWGRYKENENTVLVCTLRNNKDTLLAAHELMGLVDEVNKIKVLK